MQRLFVSGVLSLLITGCFGGDSLRPLGGTCTANETCDKGLFCQWDRCRTTCDVDADCPPAQGCIAAPNPAGDGSEPYLYDYRVCTLSDEVGCADDSECIDELECGPDSVCRERCNDDLPCPNGYDCVEDVCVEVSASVGPDVLRRPAADLRLSVLDVRLRGGAGRS